MKNKFGLLLATLLTAATLSAHASVVGAYADLDENPALTEEATVVAPGVTQPAKIGTPCPCNDEPGSINKVSENARKNNAYGSMLTGSGTSPIPANSAGGTQ
jgi:hypothetical protein